MDTPTDELGDREQIVADARRATALHEPDLRRLGAVGEIGVGVDPAEPTWRQWWARCELRRASLGVPSSMERRTPLLAAGYGTAVEAMGALVELAARPRVDP